MTNDSKYEVNLAFVLPEPEQDIEELKKTLFETVDVVAKGGKTPAKAPAAKPKGKDAVVTPQCFYVQPQRVTLQPGQS